MIEGASGKEIAILTQSAHIGRGSDVHVGVDKSRHQHAAVGMNGGVGLTVVHITNLVDAISADDHRLVAQHGMAIFFRHHNVAGANRGDWFFPGLVRFQGKSS